MFDRVKANVETGKQAAASYTESTETTESPDGPSLAGDDRGQSTMNSATRAVELIVALVVGGLVAAFLLPVAIEEIVGVDTSSWGSGASSMWDIMDVIIVLAVFLFFIGVALAATNRL